MAMDRGVTVGFVMALFAASFTYWFELGFLDRFCFVMVIIVVDVNGVGSWRIPVECRWAAELISTRGCWLTVGKESKKGGSFGTFEDCMVGLG